MKTENTSSTKKIITENLVFLQGVLNEATLNKVMSELTTYRPNTLSLKLISVTSRENRLERLLKEETFEEIDELSLVRQSFTE